MSSFRASRCRHAEKSPRPGGFPRWSGVRDRIASLAVVGVFDSGLGGLSVLKAVRQTLPGDDLVYAADSAFAPYGDQPDDYIIRRSLAVADFLIARGADALVVACNTATAVAIDTLRSRLWIPVIGIEPGVKPAVAATRTGVVGVLTTSATAAAPKFKALVETHRGAARVLVQPCPGLVEQIEKGDLDGPETRALVSRYVDPLVAEGVDVLVLGCTHYPFLKPVIQEIAGADRVSLIDPSAAVATQAARRLHEHGSPSSARGGTESFWTTAEPSQIQPLVARLWGREVEVQRVP